MKAVRWHARGDVRVEEVEDAPPPGLGQVRVDVEWCGICGTDLEEYQDGPVVIAVDPHPLTGFNAPLIIGHEVSGRISDVGPGVEGLAPGQLVALDGFITCGECRACNRHAVNLCDRWAHIGMSYPGGLAERMTVPALMALPATRPVASDALALAEPFSVAVRAIRRSRLRLGERVTIVGGGTIGLAVLQVARAAGAGDVTLIEPMPFRRQRAMALGAAAVVESCDDVILGSGAGDQADIVIDCTGSSSTPHQATGMVRPGGRVVLVGLPVEPGKIDYLNLVLREVELIGSAGHVYDEDFRAAVDLICSERVDAASLITHRTTLDHAVTDGIALLAEGDCSETLKILISPG
jgi:(R,R)-butanediol dehydrogenase / meso-butanediol dehydrogenase / diacetyl reductase